jgi:hypothetical protein
MKLWAVLAIALLALGLAYRRINERASNILLILGGSSLVALIAIPVLILFVGLAMSRFESFDFKDDSGE